jgi:hypothetical protein
MDITHANIHTGRGLKGPCTKKNESLKGVGAFRESRAEYRAARMGLKYIGQ